jgi:LysR family transcriptional activator of nhaA
MKNWINYHHLLYFKVIAEEDSVSKAAEKLNLSQSTLSVQLRQFESMLGVTLFERQHKRLVLTEQGKVTLDYAKSIFILGNELFEVLSDRIIPSRTTLHVGALDSVSKQITLQITKAAFKIGKCHVSVLEGKPDEIFRELTAHKLDLVISNFIPTAISVKGLVHRVLSSRVVSVFGAEKFKALRQGFPESLQGQPFIMPTYDSKMRYDLDHWLRSREIKVDPVAESQDIGLKKLMAIDGLGLIPAATHAVNRQILNGELFEIGKLTSMNEELFLVSSQRRIENPIAKVLFSKFAL